MTEHVFVGPGDCGCGRPTCWRCEETLSFCKVCKKGEAELEEECPGPAGESAGDGGSLKVDVLGEARSGAGILSPRPWCDATHPEFLQAENCPKCTATAPYTRRDFGEIMVAVKTMMDELGSRGDGSGIDLMVACGKVSDAVYAANRRSLSRDRLVELETTKRLAKMQHARGFSDARAGHSPSLLKGSYMQGYSEGRSAP